MLLGMAGLGVGLGLGAVGSSSSCGYGYGCGFALLSCASGVLFNHPLDTLVTLPLIEARMTRREDRRREFAEYQARVACIYPGLW